MMPPTTSLPVDYKSAARRHFKDAELLFQEGRLANAGQLYGFNAECGLKALLVAHGVPIDVTTGDILVHKRHVPTLIQSILVSNILLSGRAASHWNAWLPNQKKFDDWDISHRYWKDSALPSSSISKWQEAAQDIEKMLDAAIADGLMA